MSNPLFNVSHAFATLLLSVTCTFAVQSQDNKSIEEDFSQDAESIVDGYGELEYTEDNGGPAKVVDGKLVIDGNNREGDQHLFITSQQLIDENQWTRKVEVRSMLGSRAAGNSGAWHLGIYVGNVKALFHPGVMGGAFRIETVDGHKALLGNTSMQFDPTDGALYEMAMSVVKTESGAFIKVTVRDPGSDSTFVQKLKVSNEDLGEFNRIGLIRSGRTGADAVFDSLNIEVTQ